MILDRIMDRNRRLRIRNERRFDRMTHDGLPAHSDDDGFMTNPLPLGKAVLRFTVENELFPSHRIGQ